MLFQQLNQETSKREPRDHKILDENIFLLRWF